MNWLEHLPVGYSLCRVKDGWAVMEYDEHYTTAWPSSDMAIANFCLNYAPEEPNYIPAAYLKNGIVVPPGYRLNEEGTGIRKWEPGEYATVMTEWVTTFSNAVFEKSQEPFKRMHERLKELHIPADNE